MAQNPERKGFATDIFNQKKASVEGVSGVITAMVIEKMVIQAVQRVQWRYFESSRMRVLI
jgi:hypothetical protein